MKHIKSIVTFLILLSALAIAACGEETTSSSSNDVDGGPQDAGAGLPDSGSSDSGVPSGADLTDAVEPAAEEECGFPAGTELAVVAAELSRRKRDLDFRTQDLVEREQQLNLLEEEALAAAGNLSELKLEARALLKELKGEEVSAPSGEATQNPKPVPEPNDPAKQAARNERLDHLAATLKGMRPSSGAEILSNMENESDAVELLRRLNARQASGILGAMSAIKAAGLAEKMLEGSADSMAKKEDIVSGEAI